MIKIDNDKNIVLIGMSGIGKSSVGRYISNALNRQFLDTDDRIVTTFGKTIGYIFREYGEEHFRKLERETIKDLLHCKNKIIATGGGVILDRDNMDILKTNGMVFFLDGSIETLRENLKKASQEDHRPLLKNDKDFNDNLRKIYSRRRDLYLTNSDYIIKVDHKTVDIIGEEIIKIYQNF